MTEIAILIAGMTLVTYLPRLLPLLRSGRRNIPEWQRRAMSLVPITAVGALIIPAGLSSVGGDTGLSLIGLGAAAVLAATVRQPFLVVLGSVGIVVLATVIGL